MDTQYCLMDKQKIIKRINDNDDVIIVYNKKWKYPEQGDDQKKCPMLQFMFDLENIGATLIIIRDKQEPIPSVSPISTKDVLGEDYKK